MIKVKDFVIKLLSTGIFVGYLPWARGTFGTILGVLIFIFLSPYPIIFYITILLLTILAFPITAYAEKEIFKEKDSKYIVIDEIVGYLFATIGFTFSNNFEGIILIVLTFVIFRIFDIFKPYPLIHIQSMENSVGIVLDDIFAGILTNLLVRIMISFDISKIFTPFL
ncbi:MAG: phosphatidylglycerophosphatase A [Brevinematia bacterium]